MGVLNLMLAGTLVVMIPFGDGLVVAADSRQTIPISGAETRYCDNSTKIHIVKRPARTVFVVPGVLYATPMPQEKLSCDELQSLPRTLDIPSVVRGYLEASAHFNFRNLVEACTDALASYKALNPMAVQRFFGGLPMFSVVVATYDIGERTTRIWKVPIGFSAEGEPKVGTMAEDRFRSTDTQTAQLFGLGGYVKTHVFSGPGKKFMKPETVSFLATIKPISELSVEAASEIARDIVQAASRTLESIPAPFGIGGPVNVVVIGRDEAPQKLP
jgi:hypothetical protein